MWPSGPLNSLGSRTSSTCTLARFSSSQCGSTSQTPPKVKRSGAQRGSGGAAGLVAGLAAAQVGRHRLVDLLGMRQVEVLHVADIVALADLAAQARIELLLLGDAGRGEPAIVVRRIEQAGLGQREDARAHRAIERARVALLEVGAARAADQDAVAGEGHALVVEHVGDAAVGVAGRRAHFERAPAERDAVAVGQQPVGARRRPPPPPARCRCRASASAARRRSRGRHGRGSRASTAA